MFHFFAKLGRKPWAKFIMPSIAVSVSSVYYGVHSFLHDKIRAMHVAQLPDGRREEISDSMRDLIKSVFEDIRKDFNQPLVQGIPGSTKPVPIKWFASSTLEPVTYGSSELATGIIIGVPSFYNYEKPEDIPDSAFDIKQIKLFKSLQREDVKSQDLQELDLKNNESIKVPLKKIDRQSEEGKQYIETLLLSENAKRYSIARELFLGDTSWPHANTMVIFFSFTLAITCARAAVKYLKLNDVHLAQRIPLYLLATVFGSGHYNFMSDALRNYYTEKVEDKAMKVSDIYQLGAAEYNEKRERRNKILGIN